MATLHALRKVLGEIVNEDGSAFPPPKSALSAGGFEADSEAFFQRTGWEVYSNFIIPQLSKLFDRLCDNRPQISVLEIGSRSTSVLGNLPDRLKRKIGRYVVFEPERLLSATSSGLRKLSEDSSQSLSLCSMDGNPGTRRNSFASDISTDNTTEIEPATRFDLVLFCHSVHGVVPSRTYIECALEMLDDEPETGLVVVFDRDEALDFDGLVSHQTAYFPTGQIRVVNKAEPLNRFASIIADSVVDYGDIPSYIRTRRHEQCSILGRHDGFSPGHLIFRSPENMVVFDRHAASLAEIVNCVPQLQDNVRVQSWDVRAYYPSAVLRPTTLGQVEQCVRWALKYGFGLAVIGGAHNGHCQRSHVVALDMSGFNKLDIMKVGKKDADKSEKAGPLIFIGAGCKTIDIIQETMNAGYTLPLGRGPTIGIGMILQGGIGHLSKVYGMAIDAIVGAVVVRVDSGRACLVGNVPEQHCPPGATRLSDNDDLLWMTRGAGTNSGIVVGLICKIFPAPEYLVQVHERLSGPNNRNAPNTLKEQYRQYLDNSTRCSRSLSEDPLRVKEYYFFRDSDRVNVDVTTTDLYSGGETNILMPNIRVPDDHKPSLVPKLMNGVEMLDSSINMSTMHGHHDGAETSSFRRCVIIQLTACSEDVVGQLVGAIQTCASPLCHIHLLDIKRPGTRGSGSTETAFAAGFCEFACVITGAWHRDQDGRDIAHSSIDWVYNVVEMLLHKNEVNIVYSADLGPDPRDVGLVDRAFRYDTGRLARLKSKFDPRNLLAYACPLPKLKVSPRWIILITDTNCSKEGYRSSCWKTRIEPYVRAGTKIGEQNISDVAERDSAEPSGKQARKSISLLREHFQSVVYSADDDVLIVTGMRVPSPVATIAHLVPKCKVVELYAYSSETNRPCDEATRIGKSDDEESQNPAATLGYMPDLVFNIDRKGTSFADNSLQSLFDKRLEDLKDLVSVVSGFPRQEFNFHHVLDITQEAGGLTTVTSLLQNRFAGDWAKVDAIASVETGGYLFAGALAAQTKRRMILIREAGKLPPPTLSVPAFPSSFRSELLNSSKGKRVKLKDSEEMHWEIMA